MFQTKYSSADAAEPAPEFSAVVSVKRLQNLLARPQCNQYATRPAKELRDRSGVLSSEEFCRRVKAQPGNSGQRR